MHFKDLCIDFWFELIFIQGSPRGGERFQMDTILQHYVYSKRFWLEIYKVSTHVIVNLLKPNLF